MKGENFYVYSFNEKYRVIDQYMLNKEWFYLEKLNQNK